jgi:hypothetical protein
VETKNNMIDVDKFLAEQENNVNEETPLYIIKMRGLELSIPNDVPAKLLIWFKRLFSPQNVDEQMNLLDENDLFVAVLGKEQFDTLLATGASYKELSTFLQIAYYHYIGVDPLQVLKTIKEQETELGKETSLEPKKPGKKKIQS